MFGPYPFERFTLQARQALTLAQEEARRLHHSYIGTEHLLLGLFQVDGSVASLILADLGVEVGTVREAIERVLGRNERPVLPQIIPTSRVKKVVEISFEESAQLRARIVGTQHLLLALMIEGEGIAAHVLEDLRVTEGRVRQAMAGLAAKGFDEDPGAEVSVGGSPGHQKAKTSFGLASTLDDLDAVGFLGALIERFGTTEPPPPPLLKLVAEHRQARDRKRAAVTAQDYEAAKRHREDELRLQTDAMSQLDAWRHHTPSTE